MTFELFYNPNFTVAEKDFLFNVHKSLVRQGEKAVYAGHLLLQSWCREESHAWSRCAAIVHPSIFLLIITAPLFKTAAGKTVLCL